MSKAVVYYHPMETAPMDGTVIRLEIRRVYVGCPSEVLGWWSGAGWTCETSLDLSRDIEPTGWAEV